MPIAVPHIAWHGKRIGILGGTFNPVHCGHLEMARAALSEFGFDQIWMMPSRIPPHKPDPFMASEQHRWRMVEIACEGELQIMASDIEMRRSGSTYTVDTLLELNQCTDTQFVFIIGTDTVLQLETWKQPQTVFSLCEFVAFMRGGVDHGLVLAKMQELKERYGARIQLGEHRCMEVSSTEIRLRIENGWPLFGLVPPEVEDYIRTHGVYREQH